MSNSIRSAVLAGLKTALEGVQSDTDYPIHIQEVSEFEEMTLIKQTEANALVMVIDTGAEELQAQDSTHYRYSVDIILRGYVQSDTEAALPTKLNNMIAGIKKFIDNTSGSTIHSACKAIQYLGGDVIRYDQGEGRTRPRGDVLIKAQLIYVCAAGTF